MDWCAEAEQLLQSSLRLGDDLEEFKTSTKARIERESLETDKKLDAIGSGLRRLQEESDGLLAKSMGFGDDAHAVENEQKTQFGRVEEELQSEETSILRAQATLGRLREILATKNDPDQQFPLPPITFTLDNFHERKIAEDSWYSPYFYTHKYGYKMQLRVFPNGTGEGAGTHVSVFVVIVPGEFDDLLTWPFCGVVTLHLVNQRRSQGLNVTHKVFYTTVDNLQYRERPRMDFDGENRMGWGTFRLIAHNDLGEGAGRFAQKEYLKDNCLTFCVWNIDVFYQHH